MTYSINWNPKLTWYEIFGWKDSTKLLKLIKQTPNDQELGEKIRNMQETYQDYENVKLFDTEINNDMRYRLAKERIESLTNEEIQRIINNTDITCWDTHNYDDKEKTYCPIALAMNLHVSEKNPTDNSIKQKIAERFNPTNIFKGVKGTFYTNNRKEDMINLCIKILKDRKFFANLNDLSKEIHKNNCEKGFYDEPHSTGDRIALMHSELSEALEADRKDLMDDKLPHRTGIEVEYADCIIRILDDCANKNYDIHGAVLEKMAYNRTRPYKHGKKY